MDKSQTLVDELLAVTRESHTATGPALAECLATRRRLIEQLSPAQLTGADVERLKDADELGRQTRVRLFVEAAQLRQEIEELEAVRSGLGRFKPTTEKSPNLDVRI